MTSFQRYAIYYAPAPGPLATFAAHWLGWDAFAGQPVAHPDIPGLPAPVADLTVAPRRYGFHATIKPPFRLAPGTDRNALHNATATLAARLAPLTLDGLQLSDHDGFVALTPDADAAGLASLNDLAARVVADLDPFRAPLSHADRQRRLATPLTPSQRAHLERWGYPYVMDAFRFHMTLTGNLTADHSAATHAALAPQLAPLLPRPFRLDSLSLFAEAGDGCFHHLHRYTLSG